MAAPVSTPLVEEVALRQPLVEEVALRNTAGRGGRSAQPRWL